MTVIDHPRRRGALAILRAIEKELPDPPALMGLDDVDVDDDVVIELAHHFNRGGTP